MKKLTTTEQYLLIAALAIGAAAIIYSTSSFKEIMFGITFIGLLFAPRAVRKLQQKMEAKS